jgi:hypothetical protein
VSLAQYLPTLLFGGGRVVTITTRRWPSAAASTGGWRGSTACCNCCCPFIYALALWLPAHQPRPEALTRCTPPHSPSSSTVPPADAPPQGGPGRGAHPDGTERLWQELPAGGAGGAATRGPIRLTGDILLGTHRLTRCPQERGSASCFRMTCCLPT